MNHGLCAHLYADDTQIVRVLSTVCDSRSPDAYLSLHWWMIEVATWMCLNRLPLNTNKTEFIWMSSSRRVHQLPQLPPRVDSDLFASVSIVRDLDIYLDSVTSMKSHVAKTVFSRQLRSSIKSYGGQLPDIKLTPYTPLCGCSKPMK